jgi:hypothetical protein
MNNIKGLLQSKTIWGVLITISATVAQMAGWDIGNTDGLAEQIVALIGAGIAFYGRVYAVERIVVGS